MIYTHAKHAEGFAPLPTALVYMYNRSSCRRGQESVRDLKAMYERKSAHKPSKDIQNFTFGSLEENTNAHNQQSKPPTVKIDNSDSSKGTFFCFKNVKSPISLFGALQLKDTISFRDKVFP